MFTSEIYYEGELHTRAIHLRSGKEIVTDAPPDNNGKGEAFSPTDLMATSLGCCMITVMGIAARGRGFDLPESKITVVKKMASAPRRVSGVDIEVHFGSNAVTPEMQEILEEVGRKCPVALSLHPDLEVNMKFNW